MLIKLGIIIFGHAHLHSRTYSRALGTEYCTVDIPHNTAIKFLYVVIDLILGQPEIPVFRCVFGL